MRRIKRGAVLVDPFEVGCLSVRICSGEYEFLERNETSLAVDDSRSINQLDS